MPIGPGKYDEPARKLQEELGAAGVFLMVVGGPHGSGFSVVADERLVALAPAFLRSVADEIEKSLPSGCV